MKLTMTLLISVALVSFASAGDASVNSVGKTQITKAMVSPGPAMGGPGPGPGPAGPGGPGGPGSPGGPGGPGSPGGPGVGGPVNPEAMIAAERERILAQFDPERIIREIDTDGSGTLETDELSDDEFGEYLAKSDADEDGTITTTEMVTYFSETTLDGKDNGALMSAYNQALGELDTDGDGNIEGQEMQRLNPRNSMAPGAGVGASPAGPGASPVGPGARPGPGPRR